MRNPMIDLVLSSETGARPPKPVSRQSSLSRLALAALAEHGQMTKPELVAAIAARQTYQGKHSYACNIYMRLAALVAAGLIEARRMDCTTWLSLPGVKPSKRGRRHTVQGHAVVRRGKAKFSAPSADLPAYSGPATLTFIK